MDLAVSVALIALCAAAIVLLVVTAVAVRRVQETAARVGRAVEEIGHELSSFRAHVTPLLDTLHDTAQRVNGIATTVETQIEALKALTDAATRCARGITDFERRVRERIQEPALDGILYVRAITRGIKTFLRAMRSEE